MFARSLAKLGLVCLVGIPATGSAVTLFTDNFDAYALGLGLQTVGPWSTSSSQPGGTAGGGVDVIGSLVGPGAPSYAFYPGQGNYIDLDGTDSNQGPTFFYRDVSLASAVNTYGTTHTWVATLNFSIGQNPNGAEGRQVVAFIAGAAPGSSVSSTYVMTSHSRSLTFTETLNPTWTYRVGFWTPSADGQGPILDNVSFTLAPVPEPHQWAMLMAGLGLVGWVARRRSAASGPVF